MENGIPSFQENEPNKPPSPENAQVIISPEQMVKKYGKMVTSICRRMFRDEAAVSDAAQEVWLRVLESLPSFRGESKLSTWIYTIASRVVLELAKKERVYSTKFLRDFFHGPAQEAPQDPDLDHQVWVREMCDKCLIGILHCLDHETRLAYLLRDVAELEYPEIAGILSMEEPSVRQMISRARRKLRNFLENECALQNPAAKCRCRMREWVERIDLPREYEKIRNMVGVARRATRTTNIYRAVEQVLPERNYWEGFL